MSIDLAAVLTLTDELGVEWPFHVATAVAFQEIASPGQFLKSLIPAYAMPTTWIVGWRCICGGALSGFKTTCLYGEAEAALSIAPTSKAN